MGNLVVHKTIALSYTAGDWELYTSMPGAEEAAVDLNNAVERHVNHGTTRDEMERVFLKHAHFGARDSEPLYHLACILRKAGKE